MPNTAGTRSEDLTPPSGFLNASREKYWSELNIEEKIERLRKEIKGLIITNDELRAENWTLKEKVSNHSHNEFGQVLVPESLVKEKVHNTRRVMDKTGDEVYI